VGLKWTLERGERLILQRDFDETRYHLIITHAESCQALPFNDVKALVPFQTDMERVLLSDAQARLPSTRDRQTRG
jgi:hypothetical protein